ncbi:hypothetical protein GAY29_04105 [Azospirillum brasilense]|uniref:helix-hairpin-helix domain-containing protein n=1 Tax=Azospirillum brasilense TaxID=192 RepID=UPI00190A12E7|nr:helix-hairpin-helix domain-containing protein [Azospirillum brasilense]MBK3732294.1 hypothetical protein [Azospirillum brasilense]
MQEQSEQVRCGNTPEVWRQSLHNVSASGPVQGQLIIKYLASDRRFAGIGQAKAAALWTAFGPDLYSVLGDGDLHRLVPVLGEDLSRSLVEAWHEDLAERDVAVWLDEHCFNPRLAWKVIRVWGQEGAGKLRDNPYVMLTFSTWGLVDAAARRIGLALDDPRRQIGAVEAALYQRLDAKHTLCAADEMRSHVGRLLGGSPSLAENAIRLAVRDGCVFRRIRPGVSVESAHRFGETAHPN